MTTELRIKLMVAAGVIFLAGWAAGIYTASRMIGTFMPAVAEAIATGERR